MKSPPEIAGFFTISSTAGWAAGRPTSANLRQEKLPYPSEIVALQPRGKAGLVFVGI